MSRPGSGANSPGFYDAREYDSVVASGEQVTSGLMAITLQEMGVPARSWAAPRGEEARVKSGGVTIQCGRIAFLLRKF